MSQPATPYTELAHLLVTPHGERILGLLREIYDVDCFDSDPLQMARKCGNREVVLDAQDYVDALKKGEL